MSDTVTKVKGKAWEAFKKFWIALSHVFKNCAGQVSMDEIGKFLAASAAILLAYYFFFTSAIPAEARSYFTSTEITLWTYVFGTGAIGYAKGQ